MIRVIRRSLAGPRHELETAAVIGTDERRAGGIEWGGTAVLVHGEESIRDGFGDGAQRGCSAFGGVRDVDEIGVEPDELVDRGGHHQRDEEGQDDEQMQAHRHCHGAVLEPEHGAAGAHDHRQQNRCCVDGVEGRNRGLGADRAPEQRYQNHRRQRDERAQEQRDSGETGCGNEGEYRVADRGSASVVAAFQDRESGAGDEEH